MKKVIRNLILFMMVLIPFNAKALGYELGTPQLGSEVYMVNVAITVNYIGNANELTNLRYETGELECVVENKGDTDVECTIEAAEGFTKDGKKIKSDKILSTGTKIGKLVIKNKKYSEVKVTVHLKEDGETKGSVDNITIEGSPEPASSDATLHTLSVDPGKIYPAFSPDVDTYTVYDIIDWKSNIKFTYTCDKCRATYEGNPLKNVALNKGENQVKVKVTSQDGKEIKEYMFTVYRGTTEFNSNKLKSLTIGDYELSPKFKNETYEYEVKVPKNVENIEKILDFATEDTGAKTEVEGANKLDADENIVKITVTPRDGEKAEYTIKVIKEATGIIEVIGYKDKKVTYMNVDGVREELAEEEFKKQYPEEWKKIEDGTYKFNEDGSIIKYEQEEPKKEEKKEEKKDSFPWLIVVLIVLAIIIIVVAGFFIFRDPDKKNNKKDGKKSKDEDKEEEKPTEEEQEELDDIDSYNEEALLIAENNKKEEKDKKAEEKKDKEEDKVEEEKSTEEEKEQPKEEKVVKEETIEDYEEEKSPTMDIDEALSDLMNTKEYDFKDEL